MKKYYFTFGQVHSTRAGQNLSEFYVLVEAEDYEKARNLFIVEFTSVYMDRPDMFAFQYSEDRFNSEFCRRGEFFHIKQSL